MIRISFALLLLTSCTGLTGSAQRGDTGAQGPQGERGPKGDTGSKGDAGSDGVCDASACTSVTSVNGLGGGTLTGQLTVPSVNVTSSITVDSGSAPNPRGIVVARGGKQTSINGFYCGKTSFNVDGLLSDQTQTQPPNGIHGVLRQAKNHCEVACSHAAAHPCSTGEILQSIQLGGGSATFTANEPNAAVPMPPSNGSAVYWVLPPDGNAECFSWTGGGTTLKGVVYKFIADEGAFLKENCDQAHPLLCCL
ncbi:MAG: collagen-like protein [Deltaproteobacteria bacterium]|nr:collagen-like protein [Deltaproteobacteria bacterium]